MSLEEALSRNTETMERLIKVLENQQVTTDAPIPKDDYPTPTKNVETVAEPTVAKATPVKKAPPKKAKKEEVVEKSVNTGGETSLFEQADSVIESTATEVVVEEKAVEVGSAPVSEGSEWYKYTMSLCARYSAATGDPAATQAICAKHKVTDLSKADDYSLSQIALEIEPFLGIKR